VADRGITMEDGRVALDEDFPGTPFTEAAPRVGDDLEAAG
jgi:hypothetical protein